MTNSISCGFDHVWIDRMYNKQTNKQTKYEVYWNFVHVFSPSYNPENAFIHVMRNSSRNLSAVRRITILSTTKFRVINLHGPYRNKV